MRYRHAPNSMLVNWLLFVLALMIERLYRIRHLHRGAHPIHTSMQLKTLSGSLSGPLTLTAVETRRGHRAGIDL